MATIEVPDPVGPSEIFAERVDAWRIAYGLLVGSELRAEMNTEDVLELARFIATE